MRERVFALAAISGEAGVLHHENQHQTALDHVDVGRISSAVAEGRTGYRLAKAVALLDPGASLFPRRVRDRLAQRFRTRSF